MKRLIISLCVIVSFNTQIAFGHTSSYRSGEESYIPINHNKNGITETEFYNTASILHGLYTDAIYEKGEVGFSMNADWYDETINAFAVREPGLWSVFINGGMARAAGMNKDGLAFILCHEIGHHLGGAPRTFKYDGWPSSEGQADYWAGSKCLKKYYQFLKDEPFEMDSHVPEKAIKECGVVYNNSLDYRVCLRTMNAIVGFAKFINSLPDTKQFVSILTPETKEVRGTNTNDYPRAQCRIDTIYSGALCNLDASLKTSDDDQRIGNCNDQKKPGARPRCWYRP